MLSPCRYCSVLSLSVSVGPRARSGLTVRLTHRMAVAPGRTLSPTQTHARERQGPGAGAAGNPHLSPPAPCWAAVTMETDSSAAAVPHRKSVDKVLHLSPVK
ncbi:hypothetical protein chiPu_0031945 [Chiloscyllium punctatum]|uniref:Uncharacterized protein n=1 Tax=Chiloscyllium punctatum TaxID=137246 RepID=A0A401TYV4_CHIPU|nr:hypothetical protein [Chiloscyllium punctatum]